jgi:single-strand DNA-binding protein
MAKGVNKVILLGNIGRDPDIRTLPGGSPVANLSLATSEFVKDKRGEKQERTEWHRCVAFGRTAEIIRDYAAKGSKVFVEGRLQTRSWEKDGEKRYATEIIIHHLQMLDFKRDGAQHSRSEEAGEYQRGVSNDYGSQGVTDEDIPF